MVVRYEEERILQGAGEVYSVRRLCSCGRGSGRPARDYAEMCRVLATSENGVIHRRQIFDQVGLYDEDYFAMFEDIDFGIRCLIKGKRCLYVPEARVRHKMGLCRDIHVTYEAEMATTRNAALMAAKTLPLPLLLIGILAVGWRELRITLPLRPQYYRFFRERARRSRGRSKARWEGLRTGWAKRRSVWGARENSRREIYRWLLRGEGPV